MDRIGSDSTRSLPIRGAAGASGLQVPGLRDGASIVFKALSPSSEGRWTVLVKGVRLDAAVSTPLKPGLLYSARAQALPDRPGWALRVLGPAGEGRAADFLRASGLPGDPAAELALRALMAEGLSLDPKWIARLRAALLKGELSEDRAALLARALAKGLDPQAYADAVEAASAGDEGDSGGGRDGREDGDGEEGRPGGGQSGGRGDGAAGGEDRRDGNGGPEGGKATESPGAVPAWKTFQVDGGGDPEGPGSLAGLLRHLAGRTGDRPDPRQLFNARSGPRGRWIYAPYRFERGGVAFSGTLRILVPEGGRSGAVLSADVRVEDGNRTRRYDFDLRGDSQGPKLGLSARSGPVQAGLARSLQDLERSLADLGCRVERAVPGDTENPVFGYPAVDEHA